MGKRIARRQKGLEAFGLYEILTENPNVRSISFAMPFNILLWFNVTKQLATEAMAGA